MSISGSERMPLPRGCATGEAEGHGRAEQELDHRRSEEPRPAVPAAVAEREYLFPRCGPLLL